MRRPRDREYCDAFLSLRDLRSPYGKDHRRPTPNGEKTHLVRYADTNGVDLVVVASHGHKGITARLGSTAKAMHRHAACEVIVVPAEGDQGAT